MCEKPEDVMPRKPRHDRGKTCHKCKREPGQLVVRHFVYCKECFFAHAHSKFRKQVPAREAYKPRDADADPPLTVAFSGGLGASVLLDLVARTYRREGARKPVWSPITALYVETCNAYDGVPDRIEHVREFVETYKGVDLVVLRIEDAFETRDGEPLLALSLADERLPISSSSSPATPIAELRAHLAALPTPTARAQAVSALVQALVLRAASPTGPILFGTHLTALAVSLIAGVAHGAGFALGAPPRVVRPLQELGAKECAFYAHWRSLAPVRRARPPGPESIVGITRDFIVRLDRDFPSTVSAVARTCGKVVPKRDSSGPPLSCALCERPAQRGVLEWKARTAIRSLDPESAQTLDVQDGAAEELCYTCHTMLTSRARVRGVNDTDLALPVPSWTTSMVRERRSAMRESVNEFILDDASDEEG